MTGPRPSSPPVRRPGGVTRAAILLALAAATAAVPVGCNILGPATYLAFGLPKVPAEHDLMDRSTVVFVDDRANVISSNARALRVAVATQVTDSLMQNEVLTPETAVDARDALGIVISQDRHSDPMPIEEIGKAVDAEQVIYIEMLTFLTEEQGAPRPTAACRVRVIDVANKVRLYPPVDAMTPGRTVSVQLPPVDPAAYRSQSSRVEVLRALAMLLGEDTAKLFYEHEARELGRNLSSAPQTR